MLQFKLVLLGDSSVGKSSIVQRFVKNSFDDNRESTIGAAFLSQTIKIKTSSFGNAVRDDEDGEQQQQQDSSDNEVPIKFEIWDTAGQERYKSLAPMYYRNANAAIIVYDITQKDSLSKAIKWVDELKNKLGDDSKVIISLIGNKLDLVNDLDTNRQVTFEEAKELSLSNGLLFHEVSAKKSIGINEIFQEIGENLYNINQEKLLSRNPLNGNNNNNNSKNSSMNIELNRPSTNDPTSCCS